MGNAHSTTERLPTQSAVTLEADCDRVDDNKSFNRYIDDDETLNL